MKYVALLRGINVGGNNTIKMADLKAALEAKDFEDVRTYINSGNIIFYHKMILNVESSRVLNDASKTISTWTFR